MNSLPDIHASEQAGSCLVVIDVQLGFRDQSYWGVPSNPAAVENIQSLVSRFQELSLPIVVVRHNSLNAKSPLSPSSPGNELEPFLVGVGEIEVSKNVNSAFYGQPDLHLWLQEKGIRKLVICGLTTNYCCETTARMGGNLGYKVDFVLDATSTFDLPRPTGGTIAGAEVMQMTAANLADEFATVYQSTRDFLISHR